MIDLFLVGIQAFSLHNFFAATPNIVFFEAISLGCFIDFPIEFATPIAGRLFLTVGARTPLIRPLNALSEVTATERSVVLVWLYPQFQINGTIETSTLLDQVLTNAVSNRAMPLEDVV